MTKWKPTPSFVKHKREVFKNEINISSFIYKIGESKKLRLPSKEIPVTKITSSETKEKINYLKKCLLNYRKLTGYGRGVTAVQVGIPERFSVIYKGQTITNIKNKKDVTDKNIQVIINPKITKKSKHLLNYPESCMSASPVIVPTIRPSWIEFEYYDEEGNLKHWDTKDETDVGKMMNRVFMHEFDHMEGIVNVDIVKDPSKIILWSDPDFYKNAEFTKV